MRLGSLPFIRMNATPMTATEVLYRQQEAAKSLARKIDDLILKELMPRIDYRQAIIEAVNVVLFDEWNFGSGDPALLEDMNYLDALSEDIDVKFAIRQLQTSITVESSWDVVRQRMLFHAKIEEITYPTLSAFGAT